jgi:hypothetical protein
MDRITKSYLDTFREEQSLPDMDESTLFEYFADYCVVSDIYDDEFDLDEVHTGGERDLSQDGIAVIVNGVLVTDKDEAEDLLQANGFLHVRFIYIQAKTSSGFSGEQIAAFMDGVEEFFAESPKVTASQKVEDLRSLMSWIYENSVKFKGRRPTCEMHYVTTGKWVDDEYLVATIGKRVQRFEEMNLFERVQFKSLGAKEIQDLYQRSKNSVSVEFTFANRVTLPEIPGIAQSYLGVIPLSEYMALITDSDGNIRKQLFYDNVRDYQGENPVNGEISNTLSTTSGQERFAVLNNGITLVARNLQTTANKFVVTDYQIVNGCQTSHVLFNARDSLGANIHVPLKVISTGDEEIINSIITATNRQTQVTDEDLLALNSFHKRLEALYASFPETKKKLYYERRSRQYSSMPGIEKVRIISKAQQVRVFGAMFLDEPHRAARYYADLKAQIGFKIFNSDHQLEPYYASAYAYYKLEFLFRRDALSVTYKPSRFHLLMALRYITGPENMPALTANQMQRYSMALCDVLWSDSEILSGFEKAIKAVDRALNGIPCTRDAIKTQTFTDAVKLAAVELRSA